jgi:hypothetical protein
VEGKDPGKKWIQEEVGCRLEEGVPPCKDGMAQGKLCQERLDQEPGRTKNPKMTKGRGETVGKPGMKNGIRD